MIRKSLLLKIFDASFMQRWNDKVRPMELTELDKQAHKMVVAYVLGKFEESRPGFSWIELIEGGLFELLQRMVLTDLKPPIFYKIKADARKYQQLNAWVYKELEPFISTLGADFCRRFREHFESPEETPNQRILRAAHFYATQWEFGIIEKANPNAYEMDTIRADLREKQEKYSDLPGIRALSQSPAIRQFVDLCGQLRFQIRWSNLHRIPPTSVMGHMLYVALLSYLFTLEINGCQRRCVNNYFTGLFHDLPEVLTRDIISPVKQSVEGLSDLIKDYEKELMEKEVFALIPETWHPEIRLFTENEFETWVFEDGKTVKTTPEEINRRYNRDDFNPRDGQLVKAVDQLAAFIEAYVAIRNGSASQELLQAELFIKRKYQEQTPQLAGINLAELYHDFD